MNRNTRRYRLRRRNTMASTSSDALPPDILHPELMSKKDLIATLQCRAIKIPDMESLDKSVLVDLCYKNVVPLPQRKYRDNRKGREMTRKQILIAKRKRSHEEISGAEKEKSSSSRFLCSFDLPKSNAPPKNRLKPPPSAINSDRKVIRLNHKSSTTSVSSASTKPGVIRLSSSSSSSTAADRLEIKTIKPAPKLEQKTSSSNGDTKNSIPVTKSTTRTASAIIIHKEATSGVKVTRIVPSSKEEEASGGKRRKIKLNRSSAVPTKEELHPRVELPAKKEGATKSETDMDTESPTTDMTKKFKTVSVDWP